MNALRTLASFAVALSSALVLAASRGATLTLPEFLSSLGSVHLRFVVPNV